MSYTLYSSKDKIEFDFEEQHDSLPATIGALGKWLHVRALNLDAKLDETRGEYKGPIDEYWFIFKGKDNVNGILISSVHIVIKRH